MADKSPTYNKAVKKRALIRKHILGVYKNSLTQAGLDRLPTMHSVAKAFRDCAYEMASKIEGLNRIITKPSRRGFSTDGKIVRYIVENLKNMEPKTAEEAKRIQEYIEINRSLNHASGTFREAYVSVISAVVQGWWHQARLLPEGPQITSKYDEVVKYLSPTRTNPENPRAMLNLAQR